MLSNFKPLLFVNYDITAIFDSSGAKYKMAFVGIVNGLGKLPQTQRIFNGFSFNINAEDTLATTLSNLGVEIDKTWENYKKQAVAEFTKTLYDAAEKEGKPQSIKVSAQKAEKYFDTNYRRVKYRVFAPDYTDSRYRAGDNENIRVATKRADGSFNFGKGVGVEEIIKRLMASSNGVINDGKGTKEGKKYIYKIVSGVQSTDTEFVVEYYVKKYEMATLPYDAAFNGEEYTPPAGQSIEFNYIFTGKNVDIKNFDIKMEMGMAFFQIAATTDTLPQAKNVGAGDTNKMVKTTGSALVASKGKKPRNLTPLFFGSKINQSMARNTKNPVDSASFQSLLNRHAALENIEAKMVIFGNPQLLGEMQVLPTDLAKKETEKPKEGKTINPGWLNSPTLAKVNIKMPVDANDFNTEYEDFWYTGYYTIFAVKQMFSDGEFLQELDMMSLPVASKLESKTEEERTEAEDKEIWKNIQDHFGITPKTQSGETDVDKRTVAQSATATKAANK